MYHLYKITLLLFFTLQFNVALHLRFSIMSSCTYVKLELIDRASNNESSSSSAKRIYLDDILTTDFREVEKRSSRL